jgi:hypothetical protein
MRYVAPLLAASFAALSGAAAPVAAQTPPPAPQAAQTVDLQATIAKADARELAAIEAREGRDENWQVKNVLIAARNAVDLLPTLRRPVIGLPQFDAALNAYAEAVKAMDAYGAAHPKAFFVFDSEPHEMLSKLRDLRELAGRAKGDAWHNGGDAIAWIVNKDYKTMVLNSMHAAQFAK